MRRARFRVVSGVLALALWVSPAWAQAPGPPPPAPGPGATEQEPGEEAPPAEPRIGPIPARPDVSGPVLGAPGPAIVAPPPLIGPDLFNPSPPLGPVTITPSFTISGEYNDNVFLTEDGDADFIIGFTPGVTLSVRRPTFRLDAGYNLTAEIYADNTDLSDINAHRLFVNGEYELTPRLRIGAFESFVFSRDTNVVSAEAIASGRRDSISNTLGAGLAYDWTRLTTIRVFGSHSLQIFEDDDVGGADTTTYRLGGAVDHRFTRRFLGTAGYDFGFISAEDEDDAVTHTFSVGGRYEITRTLSGFLSGGPTIVDQDGDVTVAPSVAAGLLQRLPFGSASLSYSRSVGTGGGFGGVTENQDVTANLSVTTWIRGLVLGLTPRFATSESLDEDAANEVDLQTFTVSLDATYQLTRVISLIASYTFYAQRSDGALGADVDQNRLFFGVQFGYPIALQ